MILQLQPFMSLDFYLNLTTSVLQYLFCNVFRITKYLPVLSDFRYSCSCICCSHIFLSMACKVPYHFLHSRFSAARCTNREYCAILYLLIDCKLTRMKRKFSFLTLLKSTDFSRLNNVIIGLLLKI